MKLPKNFSTLPLPNLVNLAVQGIMDDGVFWLPYTRTYAQTIMTAVEAQMSEYNLYLTSPAPDWDHVIVDFERLPDWMDWMNKHAMVRFEMKERGVPEHQLPPLPQGISPE